MICAKLEINRTVYFVTSVFSFTLNIVSTRDVIDSNDIAVSMI